MKTTVTYIRPYSNAKPRIRIGDILPDILLVATIGSGLAGLLLLLFSF